MNSKRPTISNLLIDEPLLVVLPGLAIAIGLNEAIVLQQLHFLLQNPKNGAIVDGERYIYNTYPEWHKHFEFWSEGTVKRTFLNLERKGLISSVQPNKRKHDHTKFYRVEYDALDCLEGVSSEPTGRGKGRSNQVHRSAQFDPIRTDQPAPSLYRQREQQRKPQRNPPTPEPSVGGDTDFPGKAINSTFHTVLGAEQTCRAAWVVKAMSHPAAPAFLDLANLTEFPATGRQPLARAFVGACKRGVITPGHLQLIATAKQWIRLATNPEQLITTFENIVADAREAAGERLLDIDRQLTPTVSEPVSFLRMMAGADGHAASFSPGEAFAPGMALPFPRWVLLATYIKRGTAVEVWAEKLAKQVADELVADAGIVPFLNQIGIDLSAFKTDEAQIEDARRERYAALMEERSRLSTLLGNPNLSAKNSAVPSTTTT